MRTSFGQTKLVSVARSILLPESKIEPRRMLICSLVVSVSVGLFAFSLSQPCFYVGNTSWWGVGYWILIFGWVGFMDGKLAWLANPALFLAWIFIFSRTNRNASVIFGMSAMALSITFLMHDDVIINANGDRRKIVGYGTGYWTWLASIALVVLGNVLLNLLNLLPHHDRGTTSK